MMNYLDKNRDQVSQKREKMILEDFEYYQFCQKLLYTDQSELELFY